MQKDYVALARENRLFALAELKRRKAEQAKNVTQFPVSANRNKKPVPFFRSARGMRDSFKLAA